MFKNEVAVDRIFSNVSDIGLRVRSLIASFFSSIIAIAFLGMVAYTNFLCGSFIGTHGSFFAFISVATSLFTLIFIYAVPYRLIARIWPPRVDPQDWSNHSSVLKRVPHSLMVFMLALMGFYCLPLVFLYVLKYFSARYKNFLEGHGLVAVLFASFMPSLVSTMCSPFYLKEMSRSISELNLVGTGVSGFYGESINIYVFCGFLASISAISHQLYPLSRVQGKSFVLFLRRFNTDSDRWVTPALVQSIPNGWPAAYLYSQRPDPLLWNPVDICFAGIRFLSPIRTSSVTLYSEDDCWQDNVEKMVERAKVIVVDVTEFSQSVKEELEIIERLQAHGRTVLIAQEGAHSGLPLWEAPMIYRIRPFANVYSGFLIAAVLFFLGGYVQINVLMYSVHTGESYFWLFNLVLFFVWIVTLPVVLNYALRSGLDYRDTSELNRLIAEKVNVKPSGKKFGLWHVVASLCLMVFVLMVSYTTQRVYKGFEPLDTGDLELFVRPEDFEDICPSYLDRFQIDHSSCFVFKGAGSVLYRCDWNLSPHIKEGDCSVDFIMSLVNVSDDEHSNGSFLKMGQSIHGANFEQGGVFLEENALKPVSFAKYQRCYTLMNEFGPVGSKCEIEVESGVLIFVVVGYLFETNEDIEHRTSAALKAIAEHPPVGAHGGANDSSEPRASP